jgi:hypothetical protein
MIPASGAGGREFDSRITPFFQKGPSAQPGVHQDAIVFVVYIVLMLCCVVLCVRVLCVCESLRAVCRVSCVVCAAREQDKKKKRVRTGTRTQNLLLRRQAPYPLGHTDICTQPCPRI